MRRAAASAANARSRSAARTSSGARAQREHAAAQQRAPRAASGPSGHARHTSSPSAAGPLDQQPLGAAERARNSSRTGPMRQSGYLWTPFSIVRIDCAVGAQLTTFDMPHPAVALVHDFLLDVRGAERVFLELCEMWPEADIYTAVYDEQRDRGAVRGRATSTARSCRRLHPSARTFRALLPLYPAAIESFDLSRLRPRRLELLGVGARGPVRRALGARQLLPQPVPLRVERPRADARPPPRPDRRAFLRGAFRRWRQWDWIAAQRTDRYVANSRTTQARIRAYFGRESRDRLPAGGDRAVLARARRRPLRDRLRADAAQADRRRDRGLQRASAAAGRDRRRAGLPPAAQARRPDDPVRGPALRRAPSPTSCRAPGR